MKTNHLNLRKSDCNCYEVNACSNNYCLQQYDYKLFPFFLSSYFFSVKRKYMYVIVFALNKFGLVLNGCKIVQYLKNENCVVFYTDTNKCAKGGVLFWKISSSLCLFLIFKVEGTDGMNIRD